MKLQVSLNPSWSRELAPGDRRLWVLRAVALRIEIRADPLWVVEVFWKRLLVAGAGLLLVGYLAAATAGWWWWNRIPHSQVRWRDVVLAPVAWDELQRRRGETTIAQALDRLKQQDYAEAYYGLKVGLARAPADAHARIVLAGMVSGQSPLQGLTLLEEGLAHSPDSPEMLRALFGLYAEQGARSRALQQAEQLMAPDRASAVSPDTRFLIGAIRLGLLMEKEALAEADRAHAELEPLATNEPNRLAWARLKVDLLLRRKQTAEAKAWYELRVKGKDQGPEAGRLAAELALAAGEMDELSLCLNHLQLAGTDEVAAQLYAYQCWHRAGQPSRRLEAERRLYAVHGGDDAVLQALAALAVNLGEADTIARAMQVALQHHLSRFAFQVHQTELALRQGRFEEALRQHQEWQPSVASLPPGQRFYPMFVSQLVRSTAPGAGPQQVDLLIHDLLQGYGQARIGSFRLAAEVIERAGALGAADQVAQAGLRLYPYSEPLLAVHARLQEAVAKLTPSTGPGNVSAAIPLPATAAEALAALDRLANRGEAQQGREFLQAIRRQTPSWLAEAEPELARREIVLGLRSGDLLAARAHLTGYLDGHHAPADLLRLTEMAAAELAAGRLAEARVLHDAVAALPGLPEDVQHALAGLNLSDEMAALAATAPIALGALDQALARKDWGRADRLLRYCRESPPGWWEGAATEIAVREVPLRLALDQTPLALEAYKTLVIRAGAPRSAAFRLVRELSARGEKERALLLARETVRLLPDDPAAAKLLREVEPASP